MHEEAIGIVDVGELILLSEQLLERDLAGVVGPEYETRLDGLQFGGEAGITHVTRPEALQRKHHQARRLWNSRMERIDRAVGEHESREGFESSDLFEDVATVDFWRGAHVCSLPVNARRH